MHIDDQKDWNNNYKDIFYTFWFQEFFKVVSGLIAVVIWQHFTKSIKQFVGCNIIENLKNNKYLYTVVLPYNCLQATKKLV